ncbi:MAG: polysaccharide deacetylase family protein [Anaerolineales bacterium]|nr:polysaccharide deacetylase family protein [Anaerolineales bacterium]
MIKQTILFGMIFLMMSATNFTSTDHPPTIWTKVITWWSAHTRPLPAADVPEREYTYCAAANDSYAKIARDAGISEALLREYNGVNMSSKLTINQLIHLPLGSVPPHEWASPLPAESLKVGFQEQIGASGVYLGTDNRTRRVALTFDIGYNTRNLEMMSYLTERGAPSTFFIVGAHPDIVRGVLDNGHELANHSWTHSDLTYLPEGEVRGEIAETERLVQKAMQGATTRPYFRAPFGAVNETVRRVAAEEGFTLVGWTVDSGDWQDNVTTEQIVENVTSHLCPGAIVIMHGSRDYNRAALPAILDFLEQEGYEAVTLSELLTPVEVE